MPQENCPKCNSENIYQDNMLWVCPECFYEWTEEDMTTQVEVENVGVTDANGVLLSSGDSVVVIKDLKIKGSKNVVKGGTKVKNIRLGEMGDGHDISCKIEGLGSINLKSEYVKKA